MSLIEENNITLVQGHLHSVLIINLAYIGIIHNIFKSIDNDGPLDYKKLVEVTKLDQEYLKRWLDATVAFQIVNKNEDLYFLSKIGQSFLADKTRTTVAMTLQAIYSTLIIDQSLNWFKTGERPGYSIVSNFTYIKPWSGYIFESLYLEVLKMEILLQPDVKLAFEKINHTVVDYGCGNGWLMHEMALNFHTNLFLGIDSDPQYIREATEYAAKMGLQDQVHFEIHDFSEQLTYTSPLGGVVINRCLHHFGHLRKQILKNCIDLLSPDGFLLIWDFNWLEDMSQLSEDKNEELSFLHYIEHIQGNEFLKLDTVLTELNELGLKSTSFLVNKKKDYVILATRK